MQGADVPNGTRPQTPPEVAGEALQRSGTSTEDAMWFLILGRERTTHNWITHWQGGTSFSARHMLSRIAIERESEMWLVQLEFTPDEWQYNFKVIGLASRDGYTRWLGEEE